MNDLEALFDSVGGLKEDLLDFSIAGTAVVAANMAAAYLDRNFLTKTGDKGFAVPVWAKGAGFLLLGVAGGAFLAKYNRNVAMGTAVGLAFRGINTLLQQYAPDSIKANLPGLAGGHFSNVEYRMLGPGLGTPSAGASVMVEEVSGFSGATQTIEQVSGLAATFQ